MPQKSVRQALNEALRQEMRRDPTCIYPIDCPHVAC